MIDQFEIDLMPISIKKQMHTMRRVSFYTIGCIFTSFVAMLLLDIFHDITAAIVFLLLLLFIAVPWLLPGLRFNKTSQSSVRFTSDFIQLLDKRGNCWRSIDYNTISDVRTEDISGFFYGENQDMYHNKYICIFLNESTDIPPVPFAKLFTAEDFIMFGYHPEAHRWIQQKLRKAKKTD